MSTSDSTNPYEKITSFTYNDNTSSKFMRDDGSWADVGITPSTSIDTSFTGVTFHTSPTGFGADPSIYFEDYKEENNNKKENNEITMNRVKDILEKVYSDEILRQMIVPLFIGDPGLGKTVIIQEFAKEKGAKLVELITSQMSPFEISGIAMPDKDTKKMTYFNFDKLEELKDGDILFFDELLNGNPVVLNACLTILEQRKFISGKPLPKLMIVAAANPQGMTPITPQIKERFVWYEVKFDRQMWIGYMQERYSITPKIGQKLAYLIENESFEGHNFKTPRSIDKAVNMIINDVSTPYVDFVKPILEEMIENPFEETVKLPDGKELAPGEMISWLDIIKLKLGK